MAVDVFHDVIMHVTLGADAKNGDNMRMPQERGRLGFGPETLELARIGAAANGNTFRATWRPDAGCSAS